MMTHTLPDFERPPVVEVALSVQFEQLDVASLQLGLVWQKFRDRFPHVEEMPELETVTERFGPKVDRVPSFRLEVVSQPFPRFWFTSEERVELLQVQRDRFIRNWRKTDKWQEYPRYQNLRIAFIDDYLCFLDFVAQDLRKKLIPNQCEVSYVNIIETDEPGHLDQVMSYVSKTFSDSNLTRPEWAAVQLGFVLNDGSGSPWGRLHISATPVLRTNREGSAVQLSLTARGNPMSPDMDGLLASLDEGHKAVVNGFASITTSEMHRSWGRKT